MSTKVMLTIRGVQHYDDQEPDTIELLTEGELSPTEDGWRISYQETELTGLVGTTTTFDVHPDLVILERNGALQSRMVFEKDKRYDSLYQVDVGAFMIGVTARRIRWNITEKGGYLDVFYKIDIEGSAQGTVHYHVEAKLPYQET